MGVDMGSERDVLIERSNKMEYLAMGDAASNRCPLLCHVKSKARVDFSAKRLMSLSVGRLCHLW